MPSSPVVSLSPRSKRLWGTVRAHTFYEYAVFVGVYLGRFYVDYYVYSL